jgi:ribose/xylose/arabinose/galactoside ABC-type transport system permease subunit
MTIRIRKFISSYGFIFVMILVFFGFSLIRLSFIKFDNIMIILHSAVPMLVIASGLALVVMTGNIDISIGSITFIATTIGSVLMLRHDVSPVIAIPVIMTIGAACGAINGSIVGVARVNSFITTLGMLFVFRGIALVIIKGRTISIYESLTNISHIRIGPIFIDVIIALGLVFFIHLLRARTVFGRHIVASGGSAEVAKRMGIRVSKVIFFAFLFSGLFASIGGTLSILQLGSVSLHTGVGLEFTGIAAIVIGGISLFGGRGTIIPGVLFGIITLAIIETGLIFLGASPYVYSFIRGGIIFAAMYLDSLRSIVYES